jgi:hypothetical protein
MKTKTLSAKTAVNRIVEHAEKIKNDATQRFPEAASCGDSWRQGDVYVTLIDGVPSGAKIDTKPGMQMATGNTQGSRHCLDSLVGVTVYRLPNPDMLDGPVIVLNRERTLTHPEHGDVVLPPGTYQISYQRNLDSEERAQRVAD